jgi:tetratricopeptide (TPR) repeat protein
MRATFVLPVALAVTLGLAGCSSLFGHGKSSLASADSSSVEDIYRDYATEQLELGRARIQQGALTEALEPLRRASANLATAAAAHNAMGVVYARLGRSDVAERMFRLAMERDPSEPKFAANLERLEATAAIAASPRAVPAVPELTAQAGNSGAAPLAAAAAPPAMVEAKVQAAMAVPAVQFVRTAYGAGIQVSQPAGPVQRLSQYEVRVGGAAPQARRAVIRQAHAGNVTGYPLRFRIEVSSPAASGTARTAVGYPARVTF